MRTSRARQFRGNLRRISNDAVAFSVMIGCGETYLAAFVLTLGMGEVNAGLIAAAPMLAGGSFNSSRRGRCAGSSRIGDGWSRARRPKPARSSRW